MMRFKLLYILPLIVTVQSQEPYGSYSTSNAWNQAYNGPIYNPINGPAWGRNPHFLQKSHQVLQNRPAYIPPNLLPECQPTTTTTPLPTTTTPLPTTTTPLPITTTLLPTTTTPLPTTSSTTPKPIGEVVNNFYCSRGDGRYADPTSCGSYIECKSNIAYRLYCPTGLYFNANAKWHEFVCDSPSKVYWPLVVRPVIRKPHEISDEGQTCMGPPSPICVQRNAYYKVDMSCDAYVECRDNRAKNMTCPNGMNFDINAKWPNYPCGYPMDVPCASGRQAQPAEPTKECPYQYGFFPSPRATAQYCSPYRMCVAGRAIEMNCTMGLAFNPKNGRCEWPELVPSCDADAFLGFKCPPTPLDAFGKPLDLVYNYKYEGNCYYFFSCKLGNARLLACDLGMAFDPTKGSCVNDELVECGNSKRVGEKDCDDKA